MQHDFAEPLFLIACQQSAKHGIGVESRKAPPDDAAFGVDQGSRAAVADRRQVEFFMPGLMRSSLWQSLRM
jgi:hypothetical protein